MSEDFTLPSVRVTAPPADRFAEFLKRRGKRVTQQRRLIVEQVYSHHDHFDADELISHLQELIAQRKVSRPTVYRTLGELVEAGLLRKMVLDGRSVFEHDYGYPRHDHLYCQMCNSLIEFHSAEIEQLRDAVARRHDFQVHGHRMFVTGVCATCRRVQQEG
ncbi:MAG: transcriptional repressor [Planctomycetes bacterium]|nr:transcriptional repressor [Planctomycetota bacterium]